MSATRVGRRGESDIGLIVGGTAAHIEDQPRVRDLHDYRVALQHHLPAEQRPVELTGTVLIGHHEEMRDDEAFLRRGKVVWVHPAPPLSRNRAGVSCLALYRRFAR